MVGEGVGYELFAHPSPFLDLLGPMHQVVEQPGTIALEVSERHLNGRGFVHAGVMVAMADVIMGHEAHRHPPRTEGLVTVSLSSDFLGTATAGDWLEGRATLTRKGRRLAFVSSEFRAGDRKVFAASGVFMST